ncbi:MAG: fatty acid desaturase [Gammaproteobacteria bacterium]
MWKYLRFGYIHWIWLGLAIAGFLAGGPWMWSGVAFLFLVGVGGEVLTHRWRDESNPHYGWPVVHDAIIYSVVAGHFLATFVVAWVCAAGDPLGFGAWIEGLLAGAGLPHDVFAARAANSWFDYLGAGLSLGGLLGVSGISAAHELTHRTGNPLDLWLGRWDFALSFGTNFATEHVYGHHRNLGYPDIDPVSPKRGVGFYEFLTSGALHQWRGGFGLEKKRLEAIGKSSLSPHNRVLHAWARGALVVALVVWIGGPLAFVVWLVAAAFSKYILEGLNFFSHYGLIRIPDTRITTRNTFSSFNPLSNHFTFNLGRHGSHHEHDRPYYLHAYKPMPESPYGYLTMTLVSWIPPLYWRLMVPMLKDWDERWATPEEQAIVRRHNRESGIAALAGDSATPVPA